jgi:TonB family protein
MKSMMTLSLILFLALPVVIAQAQPAQADDQIYEFIAVDVKPVISRDTQPNYPQSAINEGIEGTVVVAIVVGKDGSVTSAEIFSSIPQLDNAALQAARGKVYSPGILGGVPVSTKMNIPIAFVLPSAPSSPPEAVATTTSTDDPGDFVDLTGDAVRITIEPERPRVNIIADRIKPEFDMMNLERSYRPELTGKGEKIVVVDPKARIRDDLIEIKKIINRSR